MNQCEKVWEKLWNILDEARDNRVAYAYRLSGRNGKPVRPYLDRFYADRYLIGILQDDFGGGDFQVMIREGRKMIFSGKISIEPLPEKR
jgi:hypothetical protein